MVVREQAGCASGSGGGQYMIKLGKTTREMLGRAQVSQEKGGKGDRLMGERETYNSMPSDKAVGQNVMEGIHRKSYFEAVIKGVRKRARVFVMWWFACLGKNRGDNLQGGKHFMKCKCLHTGHGNLDVNYKMGDTVLDTTVKEKDLEVLISADMKVSEQCNIAASKGNQILGLIRRNITYMDKKLIIHVYKPIVRPHLEYCIQVRRSYRKI